MEHTVVVSGDQARIDDTEYSASQSEGFLVAQGPARTVREMLAPARRFIINRLTGAYTVIGADEQIIEWTRPQDEGCVAAKRRF